MEIMSVSWIDQANLPQVKFGMMWEALKGGDTGWDDRVVIGLVATSNPRPPKMLGDVETFQKSKQYRALALVKLKQSLDGFDGIPILDGGWTPPFDSKKLPLLARAKPTPRNAKSFHPGEVSAISSVNFGKKTTTSTISLPKDCKVIFNSMIKFRAGDITNNLGLEEAQSPYHVPWVWCESMLIQLRGQLILLGAGSTFPSHAWYANGKQIMSVLQHPVRAKADDPALSTGRPTSQPRAPADRDRSEGVIETHAYTVLAGRQVSAPIGAGPHR